MADFNSDLIDINDPDFDSEELDVVITRDTSLSVDPPGSMSSFDTTYGSFIEMLYEARWAKIDPGWRLCLTPRRALVSVSPQSANSSVLARSLADRGYAIDQTIDGRAVRVRLVSGLTVFGLCAAPSGEYSDDFFPSVSHDYFYIEIFRPLENNPADPSKPTSPAFEPEEAHSVAAAFVYELNLALGVELSEISMSFTEEYADEEAVDAKLKSAQLGALLTGPGMGEVLRHYNDGVLASAAADAVLAFAKVFEYVSATIVRDRLINRARQKLMSPRARRPDSSFIQELQELFEAERANRQDRVAITLTARICCDAEELRLLAPECCRKLRQLATSANERDREAALENFADCLVSTRNVFSHAKANFEPTGSECPNEQLDQFRICLRVAAQQAIHYFYGLHPDKRVL